MDTINLNDDKTVIEIKGNNADKWLDDKPSFVSRVKKLLLSALDMKITDDSDLKRKSKETFELSLENITASLKSASIENTLKETNITKALAEIRKTEAETLKIQMEAKKLSTENDILEQELVSNKRDEQQQKLDLLIKEGVAIPFEKDGNLVFVLTEDPKTFLDKQKSENSN